MNKMRCSEPLPDREIHTIANSIGRKQIEEPFVAQNVLERLNIIPVSEIVSRGVDWFMEGRIPANEVTLFEGRGGLGKSTVALDLLARHSSGSVLPGNPGPKPPGNSLVFADEDNVSLVKARLQAAGADMARVYMVDGVGEDNAKRRFALPGDLALLRSAIEHYHAEVVYIDSLFNSFGQGHSANNNLDVRRILGGLADLSHALGVTIIATRHWGKSDRHDKDRGLGSVDITNVARSVIAFDEYISGSPLRKLMVVKHNYGQDPTDLLYSFEPVDVLDSFGRNMEVARVSWEWGGALLDQGSKPQDSLLLSPVRDNVPQRFSDSDPEGLLTYAAGVLG
jgi:KaiC/GvpD/RAD55 family RecA-like ATPase